MFKPNNLSLFVLIFLSLHYSMSTSMPNLASEFECIQLLYLKC